MAVTCLGCCRTLMRIVLIIGNILLSLLGIIVLIVGAWSKVKGDEYIAITDNDKVYTQVPVLMIILGILILILGLVGIVGALFANTVCGRLLLGLYGFVMALLAIIVVAGVIAAGVEKNEFSSAIEMGMNRTFHRYNESKFADTWDAIQSTLKCCGTYNYTSYQEVFSMDPPDSCCKSQGCDRSDPTLINQQGCISKITDNIGVILGAAIGIFLVLALIMIVTVVISCFVAISRSDQKNNYERV